MKNKEVELLQIRDQCAELNGQNEKFQEVNRILQQRIVEAEANNKTNVIEVYIYIILFIIIGENKKINEW